MTAIGLYLVRVAPNGRAVSLAHLVDSEVATRIVTRCGHFMERRGRRGSLRTAGPLDGECSVCPPRPLIARTQFPDLGVGMSESFRQEDVPEPVVSEQDDSTGAWPV